VGSYIITKTEEHLSKGMKVFSTECWHTCHG